MIPPHALFGISVVLSFVVCAPAGRARIGISAASEGESRVVTRDRQAAA